MFLLGLIIHVVFLFSIFDIYFKSPVVNHVIPYKPIHEAPADRLVLFIVDGLRADSFLNYTTMPYLRSIANTNGRFGISRTRVPTESRPGHVAILAGFYEDPSAVAKGWKQNPVDFDSVLNQSAYSWCWGTYDIIEVFAKDDMNHIHTNKMDPYDQTYSPDRNTTFLDRWVFNGVQQFFYEAKHDSETNDKLQQEKIMFFLHLLGTDTSGHTHKPKTQNFLTTIKYVDQRIQEIEQVIRNFYNNDGRTTFLMTSDHGMTDWGSHGTGDNHETETPYVLWGAGVKNIKTESKQYDPENHKMSLDNRYDINQADLTPLMSTFLSIPVPVNSIGQLPSELLDMDLPNKAKAIYSNCMQMISQYNKKRIDVEASAISFLYYPYTPLDGKKIKEILHLLELLLAEEKYESFITLCEEIMQLSLNGLSYYHNYYQKPLLMTISLSFMGWIVYLLKVLLKQRMNTLADCSIASKRMINASGVIDMVVRITCLVIAMLATCLIYAQDLPTQYYVYFLMPILLWMYAVTPIKFWIETIKSFKSNKTVLMLVFELVFYTMGSLAMGGAFSERWMLSLPLLGMSLWPLLSLKHNLKIISIAWVAGCIMLSLFSFMPVIGKDVFIELVLAAGLIWLVAMNLYIWTKLLPRCRSREIKRDIFISVIQMVLLLISLAIISFQSRRFEAELSISKILQLLCWNIALFFPLLPLLYTNRFLNRLLGINTSIVNYYLFLSVSHEGLFMVTLIFSLNCWMFIEFKLLKLGKVKIFNCRFQMDNAKIDVNRLPCIERGINKQDIRRAFIFTLYIILAFFGTGNIASLNSFEIRWVLCFTTSFQPFVITSLILLKTLSPFLSVACTFRAVQIITKAPVGCLNVIVLIFSNIMGIQMLFQVKNTGSWLEIGTSISRYVIVQAITLFIVIINQLAKISTGLQIYGPLLKFLMNRKKYV